MSALIRSLTPIAFLFVRWALSERLPTVFGERENVDAGGLMLRGTKLADIPIEQPAKFEFVLNLKTAKVLGLDVPFHLQQLADAVIE